MNRYHNNSLPGVFDSYLIKEIAQLVAMKRDSEGYFRIREYKTN